MSTIEEAQVAYQDFATKFNSVVLSTVNTEGIPHASYAPFVMDEAKEIYIFVSGLATHTKNLNANGKANVLFIEDESKSEQIFARRRLTFDCVASLVERETEPWQQIAEQFQERFGDIVKVFRSLPDFRIFQLTPQGGRFVIGFGAAYEVSEENLNTLVPIRGGGHGSKQ